MKIYVTGANGFVGKNLIRRLDELGLDAWAVVRTKTNRIKEVIIDMNSCSEKEMLEKLKKADCIVHLAACADFRNVFGKEVYDVNCLVNLALANVCKKLNVHFIFASNALIAGMQNEHISPESPDNPDIPYNISKYISEQYITKEVNDYCILRIGGIYGYNGPEHLFLNRAIDNTLNKKGMFNIQNDGLGRRNYIYVEDLCSWIINLIKYKTKGKYLIAGKEILSLKEIFLQMNEIFLEGKGNFSLDLSIKGKDQVIQTIFPDIIMHDYRMAFNDIKKKAQYL
jgi:nucleoside-diphosphate-sugar epimerase